MDGSLHARSKKLSTMILVDLESTGRWASIGALCNNNVSVEMYILGMNYLPMTHPCMWCCTNQSFCDLPCSVSNNVSCSLTLDKDFLPTHYALASAFFLASNAALTCSSTSLLFAANSASFFFFFSSSVNGGASIHGRSSMPFLVTRT